MDREIRKKYAQHQVEAILNNYISDPSNVDYAEESKSLQAYRNQCKEYVKAFMKSIQFKYCIIFYESFLVQ